jgi:hypothetical protein
MPNKNMQESNQYSSNSFIIEISLPGGKKSGRSKVLSGRFANFPLGKALNPVYYFFKQAQIVTVL